MTKDMMKERCTADGEPDLEKMMKFMQSRDKRGRSLTVGGAMGRCLRHRAQQWQIG